MDKMWLILPLLICSVNAMVPNKVFERIVKTKQGPVRGYRDNYSDYFKFFSIPYATTPLGKDRFQAPYPPHAWKGILNATTKNIVCPQRMHNNEQLLYIEDCLRLNVFVPYKGEGKKLPVLVQIHDGAFTHSVNIGGPENLIRHGVIVVNFEYRVGILGFLCLGIEEAPGNAGIKDQVAALRWVKENIEYFGGDPDNITVYGSGAGAISIDTIIISDIAKGLFTRAIAESGSAFEGEYEVDGVKRARDLAKKMGFREGATTKEILGFFLNLPAHELGLAPMEDYNASTRLGPCIEKIKSNTSLINDHPINLIKKNSYHKIPYVIGFAKLEGLLKAPYFRSIREELTQNLTRLILPMAHLKDAKERKKIQDKLIKSYFGKKEIRINESFIQLCTDIFAVYPLLVSAIYNAKNSNEPVYLFEFSYDGGLGLPRDDFKYMVGARHSDFWAYVFTHGMTAKRTDDQQTVDRLTTLITNFAKFGNPTPVKSKLLPTKWLPVTASSANYLSIGSTVTMKSNIFNEHIKLVDKVYGYQLNSSSSVKSGLLCLLLGFLICLYNWC